MKRYGCIIADPPWSYSNGGPQGGVDGHYQTMSESDLCFMPIPDLLAPDAVLLLWATWPQLPVAVEVLRAWGFEYVTGFPWIKVDSIQPTLFGGVGFVPHYGVGYWARGATEMVLIGRRGNVSPPDAGFVGLLSPNAYHSRKPDSLYEYAESLPGPYLELFARRPRDGWDVFGNEVEGSIELPAVVRVGA